MNSLDFYYDLIFGVPDRAIVAEFHTDDNQVPEASKHSDVLNVTQDVADLNSLTSSTIHIERTRVLPNDQVDGESLSSSNDIEGEQTFEQVQIREIVNVKGEKHGSLPNISNDSHEIVHDMTDNF